jgi:hypothetical protein
MKKTSEDITIVAQTAQPLPKGEWWFSQNGLIGFAWAAVIGYDYKPAGKAGYDTSSLYVYTSGGILRIGGTEAERLVEELKGRVKAL